MIYLEYAINDLLNKNYKKVVLIGTDIPEVQPEYIKEAFKLLKEKDLCFGPTLDGGYYLVGMKYCHEEIFSDEIHWGNKFVMEVTMHISNMKGFTIGLTNKCRDIDTKKDIEDFIINMKNRNTTYEILPINTISFIEEYWSDKCGKKRIGK